MKNVIITIAFIILGVYIVTTFVSDPNNTNTMSGQAKRMGDTSISKLQTAN